MEAAHERLHNVLDALNIADLDTVWVDDAWSRGLCDLVLPSNVPVPSTTTLSELLESLQTWEQAANETGGDEILWGHLARWGVSHKSLVALLAVIIGTADQQASLVASRCYLQLLVMPGASAHKAFSAAIVTSIFKQLHNVPPVAQGRKRHYAGDEEPSTQRRAKRHTASQMDTSQDEDSSQLESSQVSQDSSKASSVQYTDLLQGIVQHLRLGGLSSNPEIAEIAGSSLVRVLQVRATPKSDFHGVSENNLGTDMAVLACQGLLALGQAGGTRSDTEPADADLSQSARMTLKALLPCITLAWTGLSSAPTSAVLACREGSLAVARSIALDNVAAAKTLFQHICNGVKDLAEHRSKAKEAAARILACLDVEQQQLCLSWLSRFAQSKRVGARTLGLELIGFGLTSPDCEDINEASWARMAKTLVHVVVGRCSDRSSAVRAKAIQAITQILTAVQSEESRDSALPSEIKAVLGELLRQSMQVSASSARAAIEAASDGQQSAANDMFNPPTAQDEQNKSVAATTAGELRQVLARRISDEKSAVRKAAVQAMEAMCLLQLGSEYDPSEAEILQLLSRCADPVPIVRKTALLGCTNLLKSMFARGSATQKLQKVWLESVLALVNDREDSIKTACLDVLDEVMLEPMYAEDASGDAAHLAWKLVALTDEMMDERLHLQKAFLFLSQRGHLKQALVDSVQEAAQRGTEAAWGLLAELARRVPEMVGGHVVPTAWKERELDDNRATVSILHTAAHTAFLMTEEDRKSIADDVRRLVGSFCASPPVVAAGIQALVRLDAPCRPSPEAVPLGDATAKFMKELLHSCESVLSDTALKSFGSEACLDEVLLIRQLFTLGEAAVMCPAAVSDRAVLIVQAFIASKSDDDGAVDESVQSIKETPFSAAVRAHAFLALGKLCLIQPDLAKKWVPVLARELECSTDPAVRNNVVVIMADLCVRYTSIIDQYLPTLAACLRDPAPLIRRQALTLITRLLCEEYIKLKDGLFFRLIVGLVDPQEDVRRLARFCLVTILQTRRPDIFSQHFVECIFHFNAYSSHEKYNRFPQTERHQTLFDLKGDKKRSHREYLYKVMLQQCSDIERLSLTQALVQDILKPAAENGITLDTGSEIIRDALVVLSSKDIKLARPAADAEDEEPTPQQQAAKARQNLVSKVAKKSLVENVIPVIIQLKPVLEKARSPLLRQLMLFLREVTRDHRQEMEDIMAADRQLGREIEYDLKQLEMANKRRASTASLAATPRELNSPLLQQAGASCNVSLMGSNLVTPRTPGFTTPRLRRSSSSTARNGSPFKTPSLPRSTSATATGSAAQSPHLQPLSWVNRSATTDRRKSRLGMTSVTSSAGPAVRRSQRPETIGGVEDDDLLLMSPATTASAPVVKLNVSLRDLRAQENDDGNIDPLLLSPAT